MGPKVPWSASSSLARKDAMLCILPSSYTSSEKDKKGEFWWKRKKRLCFQKLAKFLICRIFIPRLGSTWVIFLVLTHELSTSPWQVSEKAQTWMSELDSLRNPSRKSCYLPNVLVWGVGRFVDTIALHAPVLHSDPTAQEKEWTRSEQQLSFRGSRRTRDDPPAAGRRSRALQHYSIEILDTNRWLIKIPTSFRIEQASSSTMTSSCTAAAAAAQILKASL